VEIFTVILRDAWGSATEILAIVHIRVWGIRPRPLFSSRPKIKPGRAKAGREALLSACGQGRGLGFAMGWRFFSQLD